MDLPDHNNLRADLTDGDRHHIVLQGIDEIIESAMEFIGDDGLVESLPRAIELATALQFRDAYTDFHQIEEDTA